MNPDPDPTELLVERVPVASGRPILSAAIVGLALVLFIGFAIVKPWVPLQTQRAATSPAPAVAAASDRPTNAPRRAAAEATQLPFIPRPAELLATAARHEAWGIRAVVVPAVTKRFDVDAPVLTERWIAIDVAHGAAWNLKNDGAVEISGDAVVAIGATMPANRRPIDVRFWRLDNPVKPREISPVPVERSAGGMQLWLPDPAEATSIGTWPSGTYRIDLTFEELVIRLVMLVGGPSTG